MPELLHRRKIGLPPAGAKTNELIAKHVHTRGFVLVFTFTTQYSIGLTCQYKTRTAVGRPHLVRSQRFILEFVFYAQSVMLSPRLYLSQCFIPSLQSAVRSLQSAAKPQFFVRRKRRTHFVKICLPGLLKMPLTLTSNFK